MELLALHKAIKKPPRSDERDGELFCGTAQPFYCISDGTVGAVPNNSPITLSSGYGGVTVVALNKMSTNISMYIGNAGSFGLKLLRETNGTYSQEQYNAGTSTIVVSDPQDVCIIYVGSGSTVIFDISY